MLMVPKSARAHSIKSCVVPKSAVARERVKIVYTPESKYSHTHVSSAGKGSITCIQRKGLVHGFRVLTVASAGAVVCSVAVFNEITSCV